MRQEVRARFVSSGDRPLTEWLTVLVAVNGPDDWFGVCRVDDDATARALDGCDSCMLELTGEGNAGIVRIDSRGPGGITFTGIGPAPRSLGGAAVRGTGGTDVRGTGPT